MSPAADTVATTSPDPPPAEKFPWALIAVISVGTFLGPLNGVIVGVALPTISRAFETDLQSIKWIVLVYLMVTTILLPICGLLGKRYGETQVFLVGYLLCIAGTVFCALVPDGSLGLLIAARAVQAMGSAFIFALFGALVVTSVPQRYRGMGFGITGATVAISLVVAPILGGIVLEYLTWPWVFWVQLPVQIAGLVLSAMWLPRCKGTAGVSFAVPNMLSWLVAISGLVLFIEAFSKGLWIEYMPLTGIVAFAGLGVFIFLERGPRRLFDFSLFQIAAYRLGALGLLLINTALFIFMLLTPFLLEDYMGMSQRQMGMYLTIAPLATLIAAPLAGKYSDRIGYRVMVVGAFFCSAIGYGVLAAIGSQGSRPMIALSLLLLGLAGGLFNAPAMSAMMGSVGDAQRSQASSIGALMRNVGFLAGTSLGSLAFSLLLLLLGGRGMMLAARTNELVSAVPVREFESAYAAVMWVCAGLQIVALILMSRFPRFVTSTQ